MPRFLAILSCTAIAAACGEEPICGEDQLGNEIPVCRPDLPDPPEGGYAFCPGDHWATPECESCSCLDNGRILCGSPDPECGGGGGGGAE